MKNLKKISDNSLSELQSMLWEIGRIYQRYAHISDYMPSSIKRELDKLAKDIENEIDKRQEE
jgi:hypothetical protein